MGLFTWYARHYDHLSPIVGLNTYLTAFLLCSTVLWLGAIRGKTTHDVFCLEPTNDANE